jgi:hypothetical protein
LEIVKSCIDKCEILWFENSNNRVLLYIVITEKSSATLHTMVEEKHQCQQQLVHLQHQSPSKGKKLYNWVKNQSAQIHQRKRAHSAQYARANTTLNAHYAQNA